ncbi:MAG: hypothetical protein QOG30_2929 [Acidimicrobiaceae bacterium]|jgi:hypothetical protein
MTAVRELVQAADEQLDEVRAAYAPEGEHPIGSYGVLLATYGGMAAVLGALTAKRRAFPERLDGRDLLLASIATHKLSRLVAKDAVGAAVRAPFTQFEDVAGEGEVHESVRGSGLRHAIGELLTCPFCLSVWFATLFAFGMVLAPRVTRFAASILATVATSDSLQFAYARLQAAEHRGRPVA